MAITKIQPGAIPAEAIDTTHIGDVGADKITGQVVSSQITDLNVTHAKLHTTMDLSSKTVTLPTLSTLNITGNVGIGTSSPARQLSIVDDGTNGQAIMEVIDSTNNNVAGIFLGRANNTNIGGMRYFHTDNYLALRSNDVDALIIDSSGNVGIGDDGPSSRLTVKKNSARTTDVENMVKIDHTSSGTTGVGFGSAIYFLGERENGVTQAMGRLVYEAEVNSGTDISSGFLVQTATAGAASTKLRVTHDGNVGIGETSTAKLGNNLGTLLNVNNANIIGNGTSGSYLTYNARYNNTWLRNETSGVGIISLTNSGKLTYRTAVSGTAGTEPSLTEIIRTGDADPSYITFDGASQVRLTLGNEGTPGTNNANWIRGNAGYLQYNSANNHHTWEVAGTERMRLNAGGTLHSIFGYSMRYLKTINLTTSYQNIVATGGGTPANQGWLIAMSSENNFHQAWVVTYSSNDLQGNYLGGDQGHQHSKDVQWQISGGYVQAKKSYSTGRPLTVFMVAGSMSADYE